MAIYVVVGQSGNYDEVVTNTLVASKSKKRAEAIAEKFESCAKHYNHNSLSLSQLEDILDSEFPEEWPNYYVPHHFYFVERVDVI